MEISLKPEIITSFLGIPVSNSLILSLITASLLLAGGFVAVRSLQVVPRKVQNGAEMVLENLLSFMAGTLGSLERAKTFFPLIASIFLFILLNNWLGVLPGTGSIEFHGDPLFRSANSDLNTTLALALISVIAIQFYGIRKLGFFKHFSKFITLNKGPLGFFVGLLELIGEFAKVLSFSFRLFGNIFAGEVLLLIMMMLVPLLAPFPFILMEFFVGFIQALVFAMLTLIFLKVATESETH